MRRFLTKKYILIAIGVLVVGGIAYGALRPKVDSSIQTETVKQQNIKQTVLATGQVSSSTDLSLNFKGSGVVARVNAKVGQVAKAGDILANLDQRDQLASLTQARGSYAQALANYNKVVAGAAGPEVDIARAGVTAAQTSLTNAKASYDATVTQQNILVNNALSTMLNSGLAAKRTTSDSGAVEVTISGAYNNTEQGAYKFSILAEGVYKIQYWGLESGKQNIQRGVAQPLGTRGLYITFSTTGTLPVGSIWTIDIPNTQASTYLTNSNAYQAALQTRDQALQNAQNAVFVAQSALDQANATLAQKQSAARPEDVAVARAQLLSASGQVQGAEAMLESTVIRAPAAGTITTVDIKVGEQATAAKAAIVLQDVDNLHLEANISEANIAAIKLGQEVELNFDALGADRKFKGVIQLIDPASTVVSGVVNYKVTASVEKLPEIKPGMTANMTVLVGAKDNVLAVPSRAVVSHDGKKFVRVITDSKKKTYKEVQVETGMEADGGLVEITSGLSAGQEIVSFIAKK
jgi:RND family efflux transporter MFP subunit